MCYNILEIENAGMAELADAQDLGSCEAIRVGSTPTTRTKSEQALYRLLRLILYVRARSRRCSSFSPRKRFAGLRGEETGALECGHLFIVVPSICGQGILR